MQDPNFISIVFSVLVLVFSVVAHEVSHGYMAQYLGDPTARFAGRLTLNPLKHLDPIGSVLVPAVTALMSGFVFGWARPVPYNPYNLRDQKWGDAKVAIAGPLANITIAFIFGMILRFGFGFLTGAMAELVTLIVFINILLAVFNIVPIPPLDGSKILANALPLRYRYISTYLERYALAFILIFIFFLWPYISPLIYLIFHLFTGM